MFVSLIRLRKRKPDSKFFSTFRVEFPSNGWVQKLCSTESFQRKVTFGRSEFCAGKSWRTAERLTHRLQLKIFLIISAKEVEWVNRFTVRTKCKIYFSSFLWRKHEGKKLFLISFRFHLIESCWQFKESFRPNFSEICGILRKFSIRSSPIDYSDIDYVDLPIHCSSSISQLAFDHVQPVSTSGIATDSQSHSHMTITGTSSLSLS